MDHGRVRELAEFAKERGQSLVETIVARGGADEGKMMRGLAKLLDTPFLATEIEKIDEGTLGKISACLAVDYHAIAFEEADGRLRIAWSDPFDWESWDDLVHILDLPVEKVLCPRPIIDQMIRTNYGIGADTIGHLTSNRSDNDLQNIDQTAVDLSEEEAANQPTVINLVNQIITDAVRSNATDIHFEPFENKYRIRYRIDGMLEDASIPASVNLLKLAIISRIKIMSELNITEKRLPQDGRALVSSAGQRFDLRISILPGIHGEAVVIRIQNRQTVKLDLESLGFEPGERQAIDKLISRPHGLVLVTGPTGSGKTTTLYTCLSKVCRPETKIITVEDPVEYWMDGILQMQVKEEIGFTFARALRSMLRHDPDIMLIGEIRDHETAEIAVRSALTGHLVFATLHTNDAAGAATRLCDIGIEPFLVASSLNGVLAQRLVRRLCPDCRSKIGPDSLDGLSQQMLRDANLWGKTTLWSSEGCEKCRFTGYRGRMAVGEVLNVSSAIRRLIQKNEPADLVKDISRKEGMRALRDTAMLAVKAGKTTMSEVSRVTQEDI